MNDAAITMMPLIVTSGLAAFVLAVAWRCFGHVDHALTWAASFAILSAMWLIRLLAPAVCTTSLPGLTASSVLGGAAVLMGVVGFRQRAHLAPWTRRLAAVFAVQVAATTALAAMGASPPLPAVPAYLQDLVMLVVAMRTLHGRRRTERAAERFVQIVILLAAAWILLRIADALGGMDGLLAEARAIANLVQPAAVMAVALAAIFTIAADLADRMRRLANTDRLTGLLNRRGFEEALDAILASARRNDRAIALIVTDIDRFKAINDRFGHATGDAVIGGFAKCLAASVARRDLVARIGGEEFAIVLADVDSETARCAAEVLREQVGRLVFADGTLAITASFGLAQFAPADATQADLLARADAALYRAKSEGRDRVTMATVAV